MESKALNDLNELHHLANITFQNVTNLAPALRQVVVQAKTYQKSVHTTCNLAVNFIDTLKNIAKAALVSEGATKKIGDVILDMIETFKEIENMKLDLTKLFINEVIIPLESRAEIQIGNMNATQKSYNSENKVQTDLYEKAQTRYSKITKKCDKKAKRSPKLEAKVKENARSLDIEEAKLKKAREEGLRKALIEERRVYCFIAERMCAYGRGTVVYNNRISNFVNQKVPDWSQYIVKPTELPEESENIIKNPTGYKMGTVKRKVSKADKKDMKRGKSIPNHYHTKYNTIDSRSSSRPSLSGISYTSETCEGSSTPRSYSLGSPPSSPLVPKSLKSNSSVSSPKIFIEPDADEVSLDTQAKENGEVEGENESLNRLKQRAANGRSHSFSVRGKSESIDKFLKNRDRTGSISKKAETKEKSNTLGKNSNASDFTARLSMIQYELQKHIASQQNDPVERSKLKALYDHVAQDASQVSFNKGDIISPTCEPTSGWQYGEHENTKLSGWFPASYCEVYTKEGKDEQDDATTTPAAISPTATDNAEDTHTLRPIENNLKVTGNQNNAANLKLNISVVAKELQVPDAETKTERTPEEFASTSTVNQDSFDTTDDDLEQDSSDSDDSLPPPPPPPLSDDDDENTVVNE